MKKAISILLALVTLLSVAAPAFADGDEPTAGEPEEVSETVMPELSEAPGPDASEEPEPTEEPVTEAAAEPAAEPTAVPVAEAAGEPADGPAPEVPAGISDPVMDREAASVPGPDAEPKATEEPEKVTVKLDPNGGVFPYEFDRRKGHIEVKLGEDRALNFEEADERAPQRVGCVFKGWFTQKEESGGQEVKVGGAVPPGVTVLYARWERTVALHVVNGSFGGSWDGKSDTELSKLAVIDVKLEGDKLPAGVSSIKPVRGHGTFVGWYTAAPTEEMKSAGNDSGYSYWSTVCRNGQEVHVGGDVPEGVTVLYAVFEDTEQVQETDKRVTFYLDWNGINGMWGRCLTVTRDYSGQNGGYKLTAGDLLVRYLNWDGEKERRFESQEELTVYWNDKAFNGYTFKGWATGPKMTEPNVKAGESVVHDGESLYAVWTKDGESSDTFDRTDPSRGPVQSMHITGVTGNHTTGTMTWSAHAQEGAAIQFTIATSPARATFRTLTWTVSDGKNAVTVAYDAASGTSTASGTLAGFELTAADRTLTVTYTAKDPEGDQAAPAAALTVDVKAENVESAEKLSVSNSGLAATAAFAHSWGDMEVKAAETCGDMTVTTQTCSVCGAKSETKIKLEHVYDTRTEKGVVIEKAPTCTEPGVKHRKCLRCGAVDENDYPIPALGHDWTVKTEAQDCIHDIVVKTCSTCGLIEASVVNSSNPALHVWETTATWTLTCITNEEHQTCKTCGAQRTLVVSADNQDRHNFQETSRMALDCGHAIIYRNCVTCGKAQQASVAVVESTSIPHTWGEWKTTKAASTANAGEMSRTCSVCGQTETKVIPQLRIGWNNISGAKSYVASSGRAVTGFATVDGEKYYFDGNGVMQTGAVKVSGKTYVFNSDGTQVTGKGWKTIGGRKYYLNSDGSAKTGWQTISKKKYYFDPTTGAMATGSVNISGKTYLFKNDGTQVTGKGWKTVSGKKYYFNSNGSVKTGLVTISGKKYYFNSNGQMLKGWQTINGKRYYFSSNGSAYKGWKTISGKKYYFNSDGSVKTGLVTISGKKYYFNSNGQMLKGWQTINGKRYYFNSNGAAAKGWKTISGKKYYFKSNCQMATGKLKIGGKTYTFDSNGVMKK